MTKGGLKNEYMFAVAGKFIHILKLLLIYVAEFSCYSDYQDFSLYSFLCLSFSEVLVFGWSVVAFTLWRKKKWIDVYEC